MPPFPEIRVASIPAGHPYVQHLSDPDGSAIRRLPDPTPDVADPTPGQWWPPRMLDPIWIRENHERIDLVHLHFGFDDQTPGSLRRWLGELDLHGLPLVLTVHDLVNPHFVDQERHLGNLDVLVPAAAEIITLTDAAAAQIRARWNRAAVVIPHPHIVPETRMRQARPDHPGVVIGLHAKSLRANLDPLPVLDVLLESVAGLEQVTVQLDVHPDVLDPANDHPRAVELRAALATAGPQLRVLARPRLTDDQLWDLLQSIDLCVLPYRFGTHSGWLEACVDLGTAVLVPDSGCYQHQHGHPSFAWGPTGPDAAGLRDAVTAIIADLGRATPPRPDRRRQRREIAAAHGEVYRRVLGRTSAATAAPTTTSDR